MKMWISSFTLPPLSPPLKTVSGLVTRIGFCSGKAISTCDAPEPIFDLPQTFIAAAVLRASSWPGLQAGSPLTLIFTSLSMSNSTSRSAGGWFPLAVPILPKMCVLTGAYLLFGRAFGEASPPNVLTRFPARSVI